MEKNNLIKLKYNKSSKKVNSNNFKIYTPEMIEKYKDYQRRLLKINEDKVKAKFLLYRKIYNYYSQENNLDISIERIYIKSKLDSYTFGGCGIGASILAGLTASGIFSYIDNYIKKLSPTFLGIYIVLILVFGLKILSNEDSKVEMYNMFLEVLNNLEYDKNEKWG